MPRDWIDPALKFDTPEERLALASAAPRAAAKRQPLLERLLAAEKPEDSGDQNLPLMTWYAVEPVVGPTAGNRWGCSCAAKLPVVREFIARKLAARDHANIGPLVEVVAASKDPAVSVDVLQGIQDGLGGAAGVPGTGGGKAAGPVLLASATPGSGSGP